MDQEVVIKKITRHADEFAALYNRINTGLRHCGRTAKHVMNYRVLKRGRSRLYLIFRHFGIDLEALLHTKTIPQEAKLGMACQLLSGLHRGIRHPCIYLRHQKPWY